MNAKEKNPAENENPAKNKTVRILIPKTRPDEEDEFVSVNNETFIVKKGVEAEVPDYVAEVVLRAREMRYANMAAQSNGYAK